MFVTLNVRSASASGVSATHPDPEIANRGEAASTPRVNTPSLTSTRPVTWPMPSSLMNMSAISPTKLVPGRVEGAGAGQGELQHSRERSSRISHGRNALHGDVPAVEGARIRRVPADVGGAGHRALALAHVEPLQAHPVTLEAQIRGDRVERLAVDDGLVEREASKAKGPAVVPDQAEIPRQRPFDGVPF